MILSLGGACTTHDTPSLFSITRVARHLRKHGTRSEALLWCALRRSALGVRVRRQHPLHPYVVDFFIACHRLAIEIDGGVHDSLEARERDALREAELMRLYGVRVVRVRAELVERDVAAAVRVVRAVIDDRSTGHG